MYLTMSEVAINISQKVTIIYTNHIIKPSRDPDCQGVTRTESACRVVRQPASSNKRSDIKTPASQLAIAITTVASYIMQPI